MSQPAPLVEAGVCNSIESGHRFQLIPATRHDPREHGASVHEFGPATTLTDHTTVQSKEVGVPKKRLPMRKIREVMRLKAAGLTSRQIAASTRSARTTICEYLARAESAGVTWPLPDDLDDEALELLLFPPPTAEQAQTRPVPDWREVHRQIKSKKHHMTLRLLWLEWKADNPTGCGYTGFTVMYKKWLGTKDVVMRLSYKAGEAMLVDFSGDKAEIVDPDTGEVTEAEIFVTILGCAGLLYVEATRSQGWSRGSPPTSAPGSRSRLRFFPRGGTSVCTQAGTDPNDKDIYSQPDRCQGYLLMAL